MASPSHSLSCFFSIRQLFNQGHNQVVQNSAGKEGKERSEGVGGEGRKGRKEGRGALPASGGFHYTWRTYPGFSTRTPHFLSHLRNRHTQEEQIICIAPPVCTPGCCLSLFPALHPDPGGQPCPGQSAATTLRCSAPRDEPALAFSFLAATALPAADPSPCW